MTIRFYPAPPTRQTAVVPGNFDGVHRGHRALLDEAKSSGHAVAALTFDPHPVRLFRKDAPFVELTSLARRVELLRGAGADVVAVASFDEKFAAQSAKDFAKNVFCDALLAKRVIAGPDFRFGHNREGTLEALRSYGEPLGFDVRAVEPVRSGGRVVSSTWAREAVASGELGAALSLLGRPHDVDGQVVRGNAQGRALGFPTANLDIAKGLLPPHGVYAVAARLVDEPSRSPMGGVANLGIRPTLGAGPSFEVHLFDWDEDLYGKNLRVAFGARLRGERKFDGLSALKAQIASDAAQARELYESNAMEWTRWI